MPRPVRKWIVRLRMWYADIRGHHGKRLNYEPGDHYMGRKKMKKIKRYIRMFLNWIVKGYDR